MTGTQRIHGPAGGGFFGSVGRWLMLAAVSIASLFVLFVSATFVLVALGIIAVVALVAVAVFWLRAKITGRPFGPRAMMEARMAELRAQMEAAGAASPFGASGEPMRPMSEGVTIDLEKTPDGWTAER